MLCNTNNYPVPIRDKGNKAGMQEEGMMHNGHTKRERERGKNEEWRERGVSAAAIRYSDTADASGRRRRWRRQSAFSIL